nr:HAMP domain-containing protein [Thauera sp.]
MIRIASLTARLAALFAALTACLLVLVAVLFGRMLDAHFQELDAHDLHGKLTLIRNALQASSAPPLSSTPFAVLDQSFVGHENVGVLLRDTEGRVLHVIHPEHFTPAQQAGARLADAANEWTVDGHPHRGLAVRIDLPTAAVGSEAIDVLVALDLSHHAHFLATVRKATWAGVALAALVAALFGWFAAHRGLAPLRRVTDTARRLSARQLDQRLAVDDAPLEVRDHVDAFNGMLARLEAAFQRLADYSADIAHELRTPIS